MVYHRRHFVCFYFRRTKERLLHYFERDQVLVKEFARSAAGIRTPRPKDLRSPAALQRTIEYLLGTYAYVSAYSVIFYVVSLAEYYWTSENRFGLFMSSYLIDCDVYARKLLYKIYI